MKSLLRWRRAAIVLKLAIMLSVCGLTVWIAARFVSGGATALATSDSWNPKAAEVYLDQRAGWWIAWPGAARDHGTFCVSCHTAVPYALSRPALRTALGEADQSPNEIRLLDNVRKRVRLWREVGPFYNEKVGPAKASQSRGTESVINALILTSFDARKGNLSDDTRAAFQNMWGLQQSTGEDRGAWPWLDFGNEPFEANDSAFYGASLAAVAVGLAPDNFRTSPAIQSNVGLLRDYLVREHARQSLINRVMLLWASARLPGLLSSEERGSVVQTVFSKQQADGGWSLSSMAWTWRGAGPKSVIKQWIRAEDTPLEGKSDGYATGLIAYSLEENGFSSDEEHLRRALVWLRRNQNTAEGKWPGYSLNHPHEPSATGLFMSDAATAYAVLALTGADRHK